MDAARLFNYSLQNKETIHVAAISYNNIYYILRQSCSHAESIKILNELQDFTESVDVTKDIIKKSLKSEFKDFEDAIQYYCAKTIHKIECIVTRNTKDFKASSIPTMTPKEALTFIESANR
jgi:predicted nucleic acid-binding protein